VEPAFLPGEIFERGTKFRESSEVRASSHFAVGPDMGRYARRTTLVSCGVDPGE
jgi:hypothetical protein